LAKEFVELLKQDRSPVNIDQQASSSSGTTNRHTQNSNVNVVTNSILDPSVQRSLTTFSLLTHGFGAPALTASLDVFQNYLSEMQKHYEKNYPMLIHDHLHHHHNNLAATSSSSSTSSKKENLDCD